MECYADAAQHCTALETSWFYVTMESYAVLLQHYKSEAWFADGLMDTIPVHPWINTLLVWGGVSSHALPVSVSG